MKRAIYNALLRSLKRNPERVLLGLFPRESAFWSLLNDLDSTALEALLGIPLDKEPDVTSEQFSFWLAEKIEDLDISNRLLAVSANIPEYEISRFISRKRDMKVDKRNAILAALRKIQNDKPA